MRRSAIGCLGVGALVVALAATARAVPGTFRTIDGRANNLANPAWGSAETTLLRTAPPAYGGDGSGSAIIEPPLRENPRVISSTVASQLGSVYNKHAMSDLVWQWGQFLDHDISLTESDASNGFVPIPVPPGDILGPAPIPFSRSHFDPATGDSPANPRQQVNQITAYIDASNVYGSDPATASALRTFAGGRLATRQIGGESFLPLGGDGVVAAGDVRAAEQIGLTAMHTVFVREHNRLADALAMNNPALTDEQIYQTTRKIVGAQMQIITYEQFLPAILGPHAPRAGDFAYDISIDPGIANEFSTAFYRFGHTMLAPDLMLFNEDFVEVGRVPLRQAFFNPALIESPGMIDMLLRGMSSHAAQEIDNKVVDDVRSFLFGAPGSGGMDLAALNIQRGRDHGLPDYNTLRQAYGLDPMTGFDDVTSDPQLAALLASVYPTVDDIDPWVGGLAEDHLPGAAVGELIAAALVDQFSRLRDGDRFFYLNDPELLDPDILGVIDWDDVTLDSILLRNTNIDAFRSPNVFAMVPEPATAGMLAAALGALMMRRRRRGDA